MRSNFRKIALPAALAALLMAALAAPRPADAASGSMLTDGSAAQKQQQKKQKKARTTRTTPPATYAPAARGWRPADPSFDQSGRPYQPPPWLDCPVDLGYGRWGSCNTFN